MTAFAVSFLRTAYCALRTSFFRTAHFFAYFTIRERIKPLFIKNEIFNQKNSLILYFFVILAPFVFCIHPQGAHNDSHMETMVDSVFSHPGYSRAGRGCGVRHL
jgi:hypothetical protein